MSDPNCLKILNVLCPMHMILDATGQIESAGPTAVKLLPENAVLGKEFLDVFEVKRPRAITTVDALREALGVKLHLRFRMPPHRELKGVAMQGPDADRMIVNLSFGIFVVDAIQDFKLTAADFAPTDLTIEMLYLVEAKSAAMAASRQLNERLQNAREAAEAQAMSDVLTGLSNRRFMDRALDHLIRIGTPFALMQIDLDFFKAVNDTYGHAAGDHVLLKAAEVMREETRSVDTVARIGGDEFVILVKGVDDREVVRSIGERVISRLCEPIRFEQATCRISASIGTVLSRDYPQLSADVLLGDADAALYASKRAGRGRHMFFEPDMRDASQPPAGRDDPTPWVRSA